MKKMSLQWRLTIITTLFIAVICGCLTLFLYKNGVYYIDLLQDTVDAQSAITVLRMSRKLHILNLKAKAWSQQRISRWILIFRF